MIKRIAAFIDVLTDKKPYKNPLHQQAYRYKNCPCGSGKQVVRCHGEHKFINRVEFEEISNLWKKAKK